MTAHAPPMLLILLLLATLPDIIAPAAVNRTREAIERLLHRRNNAVLEQAGLGSPGTKLTLVDRDDDDSPYLASYQWTIQLYEKRHERRLDSSVFRAAATLWQLILYPQGDEGHKGYISLYLGATLAPHWSHREAVHSSWRFTVINVMGKRPHTVQEAQHNFSRYSTNWGFNKLVLRGALLDPAEGWVDRDGNLQLRVDVRQVVPYWVDYTGIERQHYDTVRSSVSLWSEMRELGVKDLMVSYSITDEGHSKVGYSLKGQFYSSSGELRAALTAQSDALRNYFAPNGGGGGAGAGGGGNDKTGGDGKLSAASAGFTQSPVGHIMLTTTTTTTSASGAAGGDASANYESRGAGSGSTSGGGGSGRLRGAVRGQPAGLLGDPKQAREAPSGLIASFGAHLRLLGVHITCWWLVALGAVACVAAVAAPQLRRRCRSPVSSRVKAGNAVDSSVGDGGGVASGASKSKHGAIARSGSKARQAQGSKTKTCSGGSRQSDHHQQQPSATHERPAAPGGPGGAVRGGGGPRVVPREPSCSSRGAGSATSSCSSSVCGGGGGAPAAAKQQHQQHGSGSGAAPSAAAAAAPSASALEAATPGKRSKKSGGGAGGSGGGARGSDVSAAQSQRSPSPGCSQPSAAAATTAATNAATTAAANAAANAATNAATNAAANASPSAAGSTLAASPQFAATGACTAAAIAVADVPTGLPSHPSGPGPAPAGHRQGGSATANGPAAATAVAVAAPNLAAAQFAGFSASREKLHLASGSALGIINSWQVEAAAASRARVGLEALGPVEVDAAAAVAVKSVSLESPWQQQQCQYAVDPPKGAEKGNGSRQVVVTASVPPPFFDFGRQVPAEEARDDDDEADASIAARVVSSVLDAEAPYEERRELAGPGAGGRSSNSSSSWNNSAAPADPARSRTAGPVAATAVSAQQPPPPGYPMAAAGAAGGGPPPGKDAAQPAPAPCKQTGRQAKGKGKTQARGTAAARHMNAAPPAASVPAAAAAGAGAPDEDAAAALPQAEAAAPPAAAAASGTDMDAWRSALAPLLRAWQSTPTPAPEAPLGEDADGGDVDSGASAEAEAPSWLQSLQRRAAHQAAVALISFARWLLALAACLVGEEGLAEAAAAPDAGTTVSAEPAVATEPGAGAAVPESPTPASEASGIAAGARDEAAEGVAAAACDITGGGGGSFAGSRRDDSCSSDCTADGTASTATEADGAAEAMTPPTAYSPRAGAAAPTTASWSYPTAVHGISDATAQLTGLSYCPLPPLESPPASVAAAAAASAATNAALGSLVRSAWEAWGSERGGGGGGAAAVPAAIAGSGTPLSDRAGGLWSSPWSHPSRGSQDLLSMGAQLGLGPRPQRGVPTCQLCLQRRPEYGFLHAGSVCVAACSVCAEDAMSAQPRCPFCHKEAVTVLEVRSLEQ